MLAPISDTTSGVGAIKIPSGGNKKNNKTMKNYQTTYINITDLSPKCQVKPTGVQDRILRRIVEKRQAQADHRRNKVMVPNKLEPLFWQKDLEFSQNEYIFASKFNN